MSPYVYINLMTGRTLNRPAPDPWLEASAGWERVAESDNEPTPVGDNEPTTFGDDKEII